MAVKIQTLLQIAQLGHPILRKKTRAVKLINSPEITLLIDNMIATCSDVNGVGIAAPQVYNNLKLFIIASKANPRYPDAPNMKPLALINPRVVKFSEKVTKGWEGCLSIPGIRGLVPRFDSVTVSFTSRTGEKIKKTFNGFVARIFQHEFDHLNGLLFLQRVTGINDLYSEKEFQKIISL